MLYIVFKINKIWLCTSKMLGEQGVKYRPSLLCILSPTRTPTPVPRAPFWPLSLPRAPGFGKTTASLLSRALGIFRRHSLSLLLHSSLGGFGFSFTPGGEALPPEKGDGAGGIQPSLAHACAKSRASGSSTRLLPTSTEQNDWGLFLCF